MTNIYSQNPGELYENKVGEIEKNTVEMYSYLLGSNISNEECCVFV
jgi:hypothetical protein